MNGLQQLLAPDKRRKPPRFPYPSPPPGHFPGNQRERLNRSYWQILAAMERIMQQQSEGGA